MTNDVATAAVMDTLPVRERPRTDRPNLEILVDVIKYQSASARCRMSDWYDGIHPVLLIVGYTDIMADVTPDVYANAMFMNRNKTHILSESMQRISVALLARCRLLHCRTAEQVSMAVSVSSPQHFNTRFSFIASLAPCPYFIASVHTWLMLSFSIVYSLPVEFLQFTDSHRKIMLHCLKNSGKTFWPYCREGHFPTRSSAIPQRNSASAAHVYLGWLTDRAMYRTPQNRRGCIIFWNSNALSQELLAKKGFWHEIATQLKVIQGHSFCNQFPADKG